MNGYRWPEAPNNTAIPIARAGYPMILAGAFLTMVLALLELMIPTFAALVATFFIIAFFRDPERVVPTAPGAVVSPADGRVIRVETEQNPSFLEGPCLKISIFMSVFNVHVNRIPFDGTVVDIRYHPGRFFSANLDKASRENEHNAVVVELADRRRFCFVQVAGLVARRIICRLKPKDGVIRGQRYGMICFGSRLDVYLPPDTDAVVVPGDRVKAGTSVLAHLTE